MASDLSWNRQVCFKVRKPVTYVIRTYLRKTESVTCTQKGRCALFRQDSDIIKKGVILTDNYAVMNWCCLKIIRKNNAGKCIISNKSSTYV